MNIKNGRLSVVGNEIHSVRTPWRKANRRSMKIKLFCLIVGLVVAHHVLGAQTLDTLNNKDESFIIKTKSEEVSRDYLDVWLDRLQSYECPGCGSNYRRVDVNGLYSYGCLQFQEATFRRYSKRYNLPSEDTIDDSHSIYKCEAQRLIVRKMYEEMGSSYDFGRNWYTTIYIKKLGLPQKDEEESY